MRLQPFTSETRDPEETKKTHSEDGSTEFWTEKSYLDENGEEQYYRVPGSRSWKVIGPKAAVIEKMEQQKTTTDQIAETRALSIEANNIAMELPGGWARRKIVSKDVYAWLSDARTSWLTSTANLMSAGSWLNKDFQLDPLLKLN